MTPLRKQRVAVVGCGFFAQNHIHAWMSLEGASVIAVCDRNIDRAKVASELVGGVPFYDDIEKMLAAATPDVVDIITSPQSHRALAEACAVRKVNAIVQKPLAMKLEDSVAIANVARANGVTMMVHENFRFQKPIREIGKIMDSGLIGEPRYCSVSYRTAYTVFPREPVLHASERLVLMDMGMHVFDVSRFLMGEIRDVSCRILKGAGSAPGDDMASAVVNFASGAIGVVQASSASVLPDNQGIDTLISVEGWTGSILLNRRGLISVRTGNDERSYSANPDCPPWGSARWSVVQDSVVETCRHWLDAVNGDVTLEVSVEDNLKTIAAVEACYVSATTGASVMPAEILSEARQVTREAKVLT